MNKREVLCDNLYTLMHRAFKRKFGSSFDGLMVSITPNTLVSWVEDDAWSYNAQFEWAVDGHQFVRELDISSRSGPTVVELTHSFVEQTLSDKRICESHRCGKALYRPEALAVCRFCYWEEHQ